MEEYELDTDFPGSGEEDEQGLVSLHSVTSLSGMYQDWFLDYASYVIL